MGNIYQKGVPASRPFAQMNTVAASQNCPDTTQLPRIPPSLPPEASLAILDFAATPPPNLCSLEHLARPPSHPDFSKKS